MITSSKMLTTDSTQRLSAVVNLRENQTCKLLLLLLLLLLLNLVLLRQSRRIAASVKHLCPGHPRWSHTDWLVTVGPHLVGHGWWCRLSGVHNREKDDRHTAL